ncbi:hypothetical protein DDZ13_09570 [Coraliomargarita sinensis]|uniref:PD-(D/E)XK endonuclease-like domain-containing protein n=1 Tax=Coraliomargarita sinensis TaxID=2174842 RepID=A0A317ZJC8_9BACT|nr:PD-(D/E)XK nuclease family protein [Coraliomargarita sinensis]PXA03879.1 hypothetical protein DDZ13_09570 [Coraliomargarita sinensis]
MKVTDFSKGFSHSQIMTDLSPAVDVPLATYRFSAGDLCMKNSLNAGVRLHEAFAAYSTGSWFNPRYTGACQAIVGALADLGVREFDTEVPLHGTHLHGVADIVGHTSENRLVIADLKATLGEYALPPKAAELLQLASYALLAGDGPYRLICVRAALRQRRINVFEVDEQRVLKLMELIRVEITSERVAA